MQDSEINFAAAVIEFEAANLLREAILNHQQGNYAKAHAQYIEILTADKKNLTALNNLSLLVDDSTAISLLETAISLKPDYLDSIINLIHLNLKNGNTKESYKLIESALKIAPDNEKIKQLKTQITSHYKAGAMSAAINEVNYSIIIPTHMRAKLLERAIQSIKNQSLPQSHEIVVVSDCIDEQTDKVCQQNLTATDTYIRRSGMKGPSDSRNLGLQIAKGKNILFLDDDDAWNAELFKNLHECELLEAGNPIYFNGTVIKESRTANGPIFNSESFLDNKNKLNDHVFVKNQVHMSCFAFPSYILKNIRFDPYMRAYEDWDFLLSVYKVKKAQHVNFSGSIVYEVEDNTTDRRGSSKEANDFNAFLDYLYVYRRHPVNSDLKQKRADLFANTGLIIPTEYF